MSIKSEFHSHLTSRAGLSALVNDAIFPVLPGRDQVLPAVTYRFDEDYERDLSYAVVLERYQVEVSVFADGPSQTESIAEQCALALDILNADLGSQRIQLCQLMSSTESYDEELDAHVQILNFILVA